MGARDELALGFYYRASTLKMGRISCLSASRGMEGSGLGEDHCRAIGLLCSR